ncbi:MAG: VOC family protein [Pirellulales bacterium]|nr:VOC family protein [Pirellulales bacterium]
MEFCFTIVYVADVPQTLEFYHRAFGFSTRFLHRSNQYGELDTGDCRLAFAAHALGGMNLPEGYSKLSTLEPPAGIEVGFETDDVAVAYQRAIDNGATAVAAPADKPWGQTVAWVRAPEGTLVAIGSPVGG